jgi:hypothetical protein
MRNIFLIITIFLVIREENCMLACDKTICDEMGGLCLGDDICECKKEYTTLPTSRNYKLCNYERKSSISTAFLELLVGFGMGHFYSGRNINGSIKLLLYFILCCCCYCSLFVAYKLSEENRDGYRNMIIYALKVYGVVTNVLIIWQTIDFLLFITGFYLDGNDIALY